MTVRRALGDMLTEIAGSTLDALAMAPDLRIRSIAVVLPVEMRFRRVGDEVQLLGDLPLSVTRTVFDQRPDRLEVLLEMREPA